MVSEPKSAVGEVETAARPAPVVRPVARLSARISAFLVDSIILLAFVLVWFVLAGAELLIADSFSGGDPPDAAFDAFVAIFLGGSIVSWTAFNLGLLRWRGQSAGMYVIGIRAEGEDSGRLTMRQVLLRWFGLHPLLFHPLLLPLWGISSLLVVSFALPQVVLAATLALALLCLVSPVASLVLIVTDAQGRALHDRLAGTIVVHFANP